MLKIFSLLLARLFISLIFILSAIEKLINWHDTEKALITALSDWQEHLGSFQLFQDFFILLVHWSSVLLIVATLFELLGGVMILIAFRERIGATLLILFLIPATLVFHSYWFLEGEVREIQMIMFLKNLAIIGGLIIVSIHGIRIAQRNDHSSFMGVG